MNAALKAWWSGRNRRERVLALLLPVALAAVALEQFWVSPLRAEGAALQRQLGEARAQLDTLRQLAAEHAGGDGALLERERALLARRAAAEQTLRAAQVDLVPAQKMAAHLAELLRQHPRLRVIGATTAPPLALDEPGEPGAARSALYRHALELQIEGPYLDLLAYLAALEARSQRVYWQALDLQVDARGVPVTKLKLFTLSQEATWLAL